MGWSALFREPNSHCVVVTFHTDLCALSLVLLLLSHSDFVKHNPRVHLRFFWNESNDWNSKLGGVIHWDNDSEGPPSQFKHTHARRDKEHDKRNGAQSTDDMTAHSDSLPILILFVSSLFQRVLTVRVS